MSGAGSVLRLPETLTGTGGDDVRFAGFDSTVLFGRPRPVGDPAT